MIRILVLRDDRGLIVGRDLEDLLKKGVIYEIRSFTGKISDACIVDVGKSHIIGKQSENWDVNRQLEEAKMLLTVDEFSKINDL